MEKIDFLKVLEASLLLFDGVPESEVVEALDKFSVECGKYITQFVKNYKTTSF